MVSPPSPGGFGGEDESSSEGDYIPDLEDVQREAMMSGVASTPSKGRGREPGVDVQSMQDLNQQAGKLVLPVPDQDVDLSLLTSSLLSAATVQHVLTPPDQPQSWDSLFRIAIPNATPTTVSTASASTAASNTVSTAEGNEGGDGREDLPSTGLFVVPE